MGDLGEEPWGVEEITESRKHHLAQGLDPPGTCATMGRLDLAGSFRLDYEYEIEYEYDFSILVFRLHIITTHTHFIP